MKVKRIHCQHICAEGSSSGRRGMGREGTKGTKNSKRVGKTYFLLNLFKICVTI